MTDMLKHNETPATSGFDLPAASDSIEELFACIVVGGIEPRITVWDVSLQTGRHRLYFRPSVEEPTVVSRYPYGGSTGVNDYLMSDGSVKAMRPDEALTASTAAAKPCEVCSQPVDYLSNRWCARCLTANRYEHDDDRPVVYGQAEDLMEGIGASEDHKDVIAALTVAFGDKAAHEIYRRMMTHPCHPGLKEES